MWPKIKELLVLGLGLLKEERVFQQKIAHDARFLVYLPFH